MVKDGPLAPSWKGLKSFIVCKDGPLTPSRKGLKCIIVCKLCAKMDQLHLGKVNRVQTDTP